MLISRMLLARVFLTCAILTEVAGTSTMALIPGNEAGWLNYLPMWALISFSYLLLAKAAKTISILITHDPQPSSRADMASEGLLLPRAPIQPAYS